MSFPNQIRVVDGKRPIKDQKHLYARLSVDAFQRATKDLNGAALKLYNYLVKNQEGFELDLSAVAVENWTGLSRKSYYNAREELAEKGYLVCMGGNVYEFREDPRLKEYDKEKLERIRQKDLDAVLGEVQWLEDDVVKLPTGVLRRVYPF